MASRSETVAQRFVKMVLPVCVDVSSGVEVDYNDIIVMQDVFWYMVTNDMFFIKKLDEESRKDKEENDFLERIDGILYLTATQKIIKEAAASFTGLSWKETPYNGNPSDLKVLMRCVPNATELLMRQC